MLKHSANWTGRETDEDRAYWYQCVRPIEPGEELPKLKPRQLGLAIIGYAVDEGVRLNKGRTGAAEGPAAIRRHLARTPWYGQNALVLDLGDVVLDRGAALYDALKQLADTVERASRAGYLTVVLGGGHDLAAGHYLGLHKAVQRPLGVVNFDAHLDCRPLDGGPNSGTPFSLIHALNSENSEPFLYLCLGAQQQANTASLFGRAAQLGAKHVLLESAVERGVQELTRLSESCKSLYVTVDMDGFAAATSPGVSAPGVQGLEVSSVRKLVQQLVSTGKVRGFDVAETNPTYDIDDRTARLAARLVAEFVLANVKYRALS